MHAKTTLKGTQSVKKQRQQHLTKNENVLFEVANLEFWLSPSRLLGARSRLGLTIWQFCHQQCGEKEKGGVERFREKNNNHLEADAAKC